MARMVDADALIEYMEQELLLCEQSAKDTILNFIDRNVVEIEKA